MLRSTPVRLNAAVNFAGQIWAFLLWIAVTPFYLQLLGPDNFGLIGFFVVLQATISVLDFGMSGTLNREFARVAVRTGSPQDPANLLRSLEWIYWTLCLLLAAALIAAAGWISGRWLHVRAGAAQDLRPAIALMGLAVAVQFPILFYSAGLAGLQRQVRLNAVNSSLVTFRQVGVFAPLLLIAPTAQVFFAWQLATGALHSLVLAWALWRCLPETGQRPSLDSRLLLRLRHFTAGLAATGVLTLVLTQIDRLVLSRILTLAEFGGYMLASTLAYGINRMAAPIMVAMQPRFSELVARADPERLRAAYHACTQAIAVAIIPASTVLAVFSADLLRIWTGSDEIGRVDGPVLAILAVGQAINAVILPAWSLPIAYGNARFGLAQSLISVLVAVPAVVAAALTFGAVGAASVWLALNLGYLAISVPLVHRQVLRAELARWYLKDVGPVALASVTVTLLASRYVDPLTRSPLALLKLVIVSVSVLAAGALASSLVRSEAGKLWSAVRARRRSRTDAH